MNANMLALLHYIMLTLTISNVYTAPPVWSNCPSDIEQNTEPNSNQASVTWTVPTVTDDTTPQEGLVTLVIYNPALAIQNVFLVGTTEVRYTATDTDTEVGSCSFMVTVIVMCTKQCNNGGTCMVNNGVEECKCPTDFAGENCESPLISIDVAIGLFFAGIVIGLFVAAGVAFTYKMPTKKKRAETGFTSEQDAHTDTGELHEYKATIQPIRIDNDMYMTVKDTV
ncbi:uncharacterized protein [Antedon mediterranea]|uniref:uncharacterized protein n=1 Tax=Antedon mediterranea TaxID=105859 RepID=UPI003AF6E9E4